MNNVITLDQTEIQSMLQPLNLTVVPMYLGEPPMYMDDWGECRQVQVQQAKLYADGDDPRTLAGLLQAHLARLQDDATAIYVRGIVVYEEKNPQNQPHVTQVEFGFARRQEDLDKVTNFQKLIQDGTQVDFGVALHALQQGMRACRASWADDAFVYLVPASEFSVNRSPLLGIYAQGTALKYKAHIDMHSDNGECKTWQIDHDSVLAGDWVILPRVVADFENAN